MLAAYLSKMPGKEHKALIKELGLRKSLPKNYSKLPKAALAAEIAKLVRLTPDNSIERSDVKRIPLGDRATSVDAIKNSAEIKPKKVVKPKLEKQTEPDLVEEPPGEHAVPHTPSQLVSARAPAGSVKKAVKKIEEQKQEPVDTAVSALSNLTLKTPKGSKIPKRVVAQTDA